MSDRTLDENFDLAEESIVAACEQILELTRAGNPALYEACDRLTELSNTMRLYVEQISEASKVFQEIERVPLSSEERQ